MSFPGNDTGGSGNPQTPPEIRGVTTPIAWPPEEIFQWTRCRGRAAESSTAAGPTPGRPVDRSPVAPLAAGNNDGQRLLGLELPDSHIADPASAHPRISHAAIYQDPPSAITTDPSSPSPQPYPGPALSHTSGTHRSTALWVPAWRRTRPRGRRLIDVLLELLHGRRCTRATGQLSCARWPRGYWTRTCPSEASWARLSCSVAVATMSRQVGYPSMSLRSKSSGALPMPRTYPPGWAAIVLTLFRTSERNLSTGYFSPASAGSGHQPCGDSGEHSEMLRLDVAVRAAS